MRPLFFDVAINNMTSGRHTFSDFLGERTKVQVTDHQFFELFGSGLTVLQLDVDGQVGRITVLYVSVVSSILQNLIASSKTQRVACRTENDDEQ